MERERERTINILLFYPTYKARQARGFKIHENKFPVEFQTNWTIHTHSQGHASAATSACNVAKLASFTLSRT